MNKWKEFDDIHTPEDWKKITYTQKKKHVRMADKSLF